MNHYDMLVIGSGPAGRRAAVQSAKLGKSVLVVDKGRRLGGVSVNTGTIPSKTWRETVLNLSGWRERGFYGLGYRVKQDISMNDLRERLQKTLDHEIEVLKNQFMRNGIGINDLNPERRKKIGYRTLATANPASEPDNETHCAAVACTLQAAIFVLGNASNKAARSASACASGP